MNEVELRLSEEEAVGVYVLAKAGLQAAHVLCDGGLGPCSTAGRRVVDKIKSDLWRNLRAEVMALSGKDPGWTIGLVGLYVEARKLREGTNGEEPAEDRPGELCLGCAAEDVHGVATVKTVDGPRCDECAFLRAKLLCVRCSFCHMPLSPGLHRGDVVGLVTVRACAPIQAALSEIDPREEALTGQERNPGISEGSP